MRVIIVPGLGFSGGSANYVRGGSIGKLSEIDVIDLYLPTLIDVLEQNRIMFDVENTRVAKCGSGYFPVNALIAHLKCGWIEPSKRQTNITKSFYSTVGSKSFAYELGESVGEWGSCSVFGHQVANPAKIANDSIITSEHSIAASIEPFALNGPSAEIYCTRLPQLGRDIGICISSYIERTARGAINIPEACLAYPLTL